MSLEAVLKTYFASLHDTGKAGDAREESFYPSMAELLAQVANELGHEDIHITVNPRPTAGGNPDFRVWRGQHEVIGYIEAKKPGEKLANITRSEQLKRYRAAFPNLILTDFCTFRLFRNGEVADEVEAGKALVLNEIQYPPPAQNVAELEALLTQFFSFSLPKTFDAPNLAKELARRTRFLDNMVLERLKAVQNGRLQGFYDAFRKFLVAELTVPQFADLYAQTITYGLFAARTRVPEGTTFTRQTAVQFIPRTIGVLHDVFEFLSYGDLPEELAWIIDDIIELLRAADAGAILDRHYHEGKGSDPIVHFYETFLAEYDPKERERRGVYYTPEPVVGYIVRSLHQILKDEFGLADGLADASVRLLDPAAGTMTFVARAAEQAVEEYGAKYGEGNREGFLRDHVLANFYGFELMMAPYAVGHLKMGFYLEQLGHRLADDERFKLYLTNTLEMEKKEQTNIPGTAALAEEAEHAHEVKQQVPILVVLGNPPYSGHSANTGEWISHLIDDYKVEPGGKDKLKERNPKWLQDDYVKFLRFAEWKIEQAGHGVVGMITNHSWLDNPTFRGMRWHLMQTFDEIRVLDLHGNSLKKERAPDGGEDQNVFDIRQGVAISFFIKRRREDAVQEVIVSAGEWSEPEAEQLGGRSPSHTLATVHHAELWGKRQDKYGWLDTHGVGNTGWSVLAQGTGFLVFAPQDFTLAAAYSSWPSIENFYRQRVTGLQTHRDRFVSAFDKEALVARVRTFLESDLPDDLLRQVVSLTRTDNLDIAQARSELGRNPNWSDKISQCLYRPFDLRWLLYDAGVVDRRREDVMGHVLAGPNVSLLVPRQHKMEFGAFATRALAIAKAVTAYDGSYFFPLFLYSLESHNDLFSEHDSGDRCPNLHPKLLPLLDRHFGAKVMPETLFHYLYAVLYAPTYRTTYADFLKIDFPRIPFTAEREVFERMAALGERLVQLHLLESDELDPPAVRFEGQTSEDVAANRVAKNKTAGFTWDGDSERVYINPGQYFAPVAEDLWQYRIGGYQVPHKWLKDRTGRVLSTEEVQTYCRILTALGKTIEIQAELDAVYPSVEESLLEIELN